MKKILNDPKEFVPEFLKGIELAYGNRLKIVGEDKRIVMRNAEIRPNKVGIVTAGGSGHLPVFMGYVGEGLLDGCTVGNVFASPSAQNMYEMIRLADHGSGVLCLYGNYGGDKMNFEMACEMAEMEGIRTFQVLVCDDIASAPFKEKHNRRGVAGMVYAFKIAGAAAEAMMSLEEVARVVQDALDHICTMGIALSSCIVPDVGKATFSIKDDEIGIGMGIHGEPGIEVCPMMTADEIADAIMKRLLVDMPLYDGNEVSVMINGLGATPLEELFIVYQKVHEILLKKGVSVYMPHVGEFATSMEMAGCSITLFKLNEQQKTLLRMPASTPFYTSENK